MWVLNVWYYTFYSSSQFLAMALVWLKQDTEGALWYSYRSVAAANRFLKDQGIVLFDTQVTRLAKRNGTQHGWCFSSKDPSSSLSSDHVTVPVDSTPSSRSTTNLRSFLNTTAIQCGVCISDFQGQFRKCSVCHAMAHELCGTKGSDGDGAFKCYSCVCAACALEMKPPIEKCTKCKQTVHQACCEVTSGSLFCMGCQPRTPKQRRPLKNKVQSDLSILCGLSSGHGGNRGLV